MVTNSGWIIQTKIDKKWHNVGIYWFINNIPDCVDGIRTCLFRTRKEARKYQKEQGFGDTRIRKAKAVFQVENND